MMNFVATETALRLVNHCWEHLTEVSDILCMSRLERELLKEGRRGREGEGGGEKYVRGKLRLVSLSERETDSFVVGKRNICSILY